MRTFATAIALAFLIQLPHAAQAESVEIVDLSVAAKKPEYRVVENKIKGGDPLSAAAGAYVSLRSRGPMLNLKNSVKMHTVTNGKPPTFAEFQDMLKQHQVKLNTLPANRLYGYDPKTGGIVILEKTAK